MKTYFVSIEWMTCNGNPACTSKNVLATDISTALKILTERVRKYKRCLKINGGNAVPVQG